MKNDYNWMDAYTMAFFSGTGKSKALTKVDQPQNDQPEPPQLPIAHAGYPCTQCRLGCAA